MTAPLTLKAFLADESRRIGVGCHGVFRRMSKGWYGRSIIKAYFNPRLVYVFQVGPLPTELPAPRRTRPTQSMIAQAMQAAASRWLLARRKA